MVNSVLAGLTAIEAMGGPVIPWQPGRKDYKSAEEAVEHRGNVGDRSVFHLVKDEVGLFGIRRIDWSSL